VQLGAALFLIHLTLACRQDTSYAYPCLYDCVVQVAVSRIFSLGLNASESLKKNQSTLEASGFTTSLPAVSGSTRRTLLAFFMSDERPYVLVLSWQGDLFGGEELERVAVAVGRCNEVWREGTQ